MAETPVCEEHATDLVWADGQPMPGYDPAFRPLGWYCPCDPGHPVRSFAEWLGVEEVSDECCASGRCEVCAPGGFGGSRYW